MESLKEKTAKGLFWGAMNNTVQQLLGVAFGIVTLRLLSPQDNGMMAIIAVFSQVATVLQDSGFRSALVNIKEPSHRDYNAVFWFNIIVAVIMYFVLFFTAPLIADYYHTPELTWFSRYAFLSIILAGFNTAQSAWLFKNLRAKQQAKAAMTAVLLSGIVCIVMAGLCLLVACHTGTRVHRCIYAHELALQSVAAVVQFRFQTDTQHVSFLREDAPDHHCGARQCQYNEHSAGSLFLQA